MPSTGKTQSPHGVAPSMVFPSRGYRGATLPLAHLASGDLASLHSLSYLWVSGRRRRYFWRSRLPPQSFLPVGIGEATPLMPYTGDSVSVLAMPGAINLLTLTLALTLTSTLVDPWGRDTCRSGKLKVSPAPSTCLLYTSDAADE